MDTKKIGKSFSRLAGWLGLNLCSLIIKLLPAGCIYGFARGISALAYRFASKQKMIARQSLAIAFGKQKQPEELEQIIKDCFTLIAKGAIELLFLMDRPRLLEQSVEIEGKQNLDEALSKGKGAILVSAHFGNFPLMMAKLALCGYKIAGIMRPMRDTRVEKLFLAKRNRLNIRTIYSQPRNVCVTSTIEALRENELVFIPIDQHFGTGGVFVDFFGRKAATATGPVVFAQRTQAMLLPCFIVRQKDNRHKIIFEPPFALGPGKDSKEVILVNIQKLTNIIESYIRKYPAEWGWIHRRWKEEVKIQEKEGSGYGR